jgi:hypothetical protein
MLVLLPNPVNLGAAGTRGEGQSLAEQTSQKVYQEDREEKGEEVDALITARSRKRRIDSGLTTLPVDLPV